MDYGYNDNVSYQPHSSDAIGSSFQSAAPVLSMIGERGRDKYLLMYSEIIVTTQAIPLITTTIIFSF